MAAGDGHVMNNFKEQLLLKTVDCVNDTFNVALYSVCPSYPDGAAPAYSATNEISVANYTAGGAEAASRTVTQDDANDRAAWDAADVTWTSLGASTIAGAVLYDDTTATKWQCIIWEIGTNSNGGNYTLAFASTGMMLLA